MGVLGSVRNMCCGAGWNQRTACLSQEEKGVLIAARGVRTVRRAFLLCTELVFPISNPNCAVFFCYAKSKVFLTLERVYGLMRAIGLIVQMKNIFDKIFQGFFLAVFAAIVVTGLVIRCLNIVRQWDWSTCVQICSTASSSRRRRYPRSRISSFVSGLIVNLLKDWRAKTVGRSLVSLFSLLTIEVP